MIAQPRHGKHACKTYTSRPDCELCAGPEGKALAADIAQRFLRTMFATWSSESPFRHKMVEKWDASVVGGTGGGGEYRVQTGNSNCDVTVSPTLTLTQQPNHTGPLHWCKHRLPLT